MRNIEKMLCRPEIIKKKILQCKYEIAGLRDKLLPGSMDYVKVKVISTPSDNLLEIEARIDYLERKIRRLEKEKIKAIEDIRKTAMKLPENQKTVIIGLFVANKSVQEIANELNYSIRTIYNIKNNAIYSMKK